jgi:hypothetical protein
MTYAHANRLNAYSRALFCDDEGVYVWPRTPLVWRSAEPDRWPFFKRLPLLDAWRHLAAWHGLDVDAAKVAEMLTYACAGFDAGEPESVRKWVVYMPLPPLTPEAVAKADRWMTQPRVPAGSRDGGQWGPGGYQTVAGELSTVEQSYLARYYEPASRYAAAYDVDEILVLAIGVESQFASAGVYLATGDAFGLTGGNTRNMTTAKTPEENIKKLFDNYGAQIRGVGSNAEAFKNALLGMNPAGVKIPGWKVYNSKEQPQWRKIMEAGISRMTRAVPIYRQKLENK